MPKTDQFKTEEEFIVSESPEIAVGQSRYLQKIFNLLPAFKSRNYRLFFSGQLISLTGTWLQIVAQGWLVFQLTGSAFAIGIVTALNALPSLLFSLFGGVIVDRFYKVKVLLFTQSALMIFAFILGILTVLKIITVWEIGLLAFLSGTAMAIDSPARNAFVIEMVGKKYLASAIALNSGIYNAARVFGPAVAGILIVTIGTGGAFILNGVSYVAVIIALLMMKIPKYEARHDLNTLAAIKEGVIYTLRHPIIKTLMLFAATVSIFGWSYTTVLPVIAENVFHLGAGGLGTLYVATGAGAVVAIILVSAFSQKIHPAIFIIGGNLLYAVSLMLFSFATNFNFALIFLFFAGLGILGQFAMMNTTIQHLVPNHLRGRVMSIYALMFLGVSPFGNFGIGWLSDHVGPQQAIRVGTIIVFIFGLLVFINRKKINRTYEKYCLQNSIEHQEGIF